MPASGRSWISNWYRGGWAWALIPMGVFVLLRLPALVHAPGGQDEHWFSVPGYTVWTEGVPRIPYVPTRNRETLFENADRCLMALPPALFYVQAPWFGLFEPGYPTARIPLFLGGLFSILLLFGLTKALSRSIWAALISGLVFAISRPLLFTGLTVRPDLLCAICGWLAMIAVFLFWRRHERGWLALAGAMCGLGALFHPFALVFAIQVGVAVLIPPGKWVDRLIRTATVALCAIGVAALWLPLIARYPYEFRSQFFANVLDRAGPGLPARLVWPWPSISHHAQLLYEFAGPWQCFFLSASLLAGTFLAFRSRSRISLTYIALCWSSVYLTAVVAGLHPTKGYWVYPAFWIHGLFGLLLTLTWDVSWARQQLSGRSQLGSRLVRLAVPLMVIALMIPGAGLKTTVLYLRHWGSPDYHAGTFIARVLDDLPRQGLFLADLSYVFDVYLSGRETLLCQEKNVYWGTEPLPYDYLLLAWEGEDAGWAAQYGAEFVRREGSRSTPQACFLDLYRPADQTHD